MIEVSESPKARELLEHFSDADKVRLHETARAAVKRNFLAPDRDDSPYNAEIIKEIDRFAGRFTPETAAILRPRIREALVEYAPAQVDYTFKGTEAITEVADKALAISVVTNDLVAGSHFVALADKTINSLVVTTLKNQKARELTSVGRA